MARLNAPCASYPIMKQNFKWAVIKDIYTDDDTADIEIIDKDYNATGEIYEKVPIFYHCEPDAQKRSNGALEGASGAFDYNDKVIVRFEDDNPLIVGRMDGIVQCSNGCWIWGSDNKIFKATDTKVIYLKDKYGEPFIVNGYNRHESLHCATSYTREEKERIVSVFKNGITYAAPYSREKLIIKIYNKNTKRTITYTESGFAFSGNQYAKAECIKYNYSINDDGFSVVGMHITTDPNESIYVEVCKYDNNGNKKYCRSTTFNAVSNIQFATVAVLDDIVYIGGITYYDNLNADWIILKRESVLDYDPTTNSIVENKDLMNNGYDEEDVGKTIGECKLIYKDTYWSSYIRDYITECTFTQSVCYSMWQIKFNVLDKKGLMQRPHDCTGDCGDIYYYDQGCIGKDCECPENGCVKEGSDGVGVEHVPCSGNTSTVTGVAGTLDWHYYDAPHLSTSTIPIFYYDFTAKKWRWLALGSRYKNGTYTIEDPYDIPKCNFVYTEDGIINMEIENIESRPFFHYYRSFVFCESVRNNKTYKFYQDCKTDINDNIISFNASINIPEAKIRIGALGKIINSF